MSFTKKRIDVTISLGTGQFGDSGANTVTLTGLRVNADLQRVAGGAQPQSQIRVFGLPLAMMNQLTTIGPINAALMLNNNIMLAAGDDEGGMHTVYSGSIQSAFADARGMPEVPFNVMAVAGLSAAIKTVGALSFPGSADAASIIQGLAQTMGLHFENNGVSVQLSNPYFPGTAAMQLRACARAADIYYVIDRGTLAIWPKNGARAQQGDIPTLTPGAGMVGYPTFSSNFLEVDCEFNPALQIGGLFQVKSSLSVAQGNWQTIGIADALDSETPGGRWFSHVQGVPKNGIS